MTRQWSLTRTEAEFLVDLIEKSGAMQYLADELRELFGMAPFPAGTVQEPKP